MKGFGLRMSFKIAVGLMVACLVRPVDVAAQASKWTFSSWANGPAPSDSRGFQCLPGDFDGNGKSDVACYTLTGGDWHVALSTGIGWSGGGWGNGPAPGKPAAWQCLSGRYDFDNKSDIACYTTAGGNWHVALSTGSGFTSSSLTGPAPGNSGGAQCLGGDFNDDGRSDIACYTGAPGQWHLALSAGATWSSPGWGGGISPPTQPVSKWCLSGYFDDDHRSDIACYTGAASKWNISLSTGAGWTLDSLNGPDSSNVAAECVAADLNADGKTDISCYQHEGTWLLALSKEQGWTNPQWTGGPRGFLYPSISSSIISGTCIAGNFDGKNAEDIACVARGLNSWQLGLTK